MIAEAPVTQPVVRPVGKAERIESVDVLRGFALLGILLLNILSFSYHFAATWNPAIDGGATGWNLAIWFVQMIFWDGKMRATFSLVFGASLMLLTTRLDEKGTAGADVYFRRALWLMVFGIVHAYLIWWGDILFPYALGALLLYPFRRLSAKALLIVAGVMFVFLTGMPFGKGFHMRDVRAKAQEAIAAEKAGKTLTDEQKETKKDWEEFLKNTLPNREQLDKEYTAYRGGYVSGLKHRAKVVIRWHSIPIYMPFLWDMFAMMLIGMALFKSGVLSAERSYRLYTWMAVIGFAVGLPMNAWSAWETHRHNFEPILTLKYFATYQPGRLLVAMGYWAALMIICKAGVLRWLTRPVAAVGQMAFSNYIMHSVIGCVIFYGYGFGLIGKLERWQLYPIVAGIWAFQLIASPIWLRHFYFGPLEWCWRSLTYWKRQPMLIRPAPTVIEPAPEAPVREPAVETAAEAASPSSSD
jgi:uncharacterized protein